MQKELPSRLLKSFSGVLPTRLFSVDDAVCSLGERGNCRSARPCVVCCMAAYPGKWDPAALEVGVGATHLERKGRQIFWLGPKGPRILGLPVAEVVPPKCGRQSYLSSVPLRLVFSPPGQPSDFVRVDRSFVASSEEVTSTAVAHSSAGVTSTVEHQ